MTIHFNKLQAALLNGTDTMSEDELRSEVSGEVVEYGFEVSDEVLDIIMGNVEYLLDITDCSIGAAVAFTLNTEGPWND